MLMKISYSFIATLIHLSTLKVFARKNNEMVEVFVSNGGNQENILIPIFQTNLHCDVPVFVDSCWA